MSQTGRKKDGGTDLTKKAHMLIRQMMFHNEIVPGQKLAYRDLAKRLNMSLTPVSNALKYLEFQGLVRKELNRGYYTESISMEEVQEIYDFRELIEISLLADSIANLDKPGEQRLREAFEASVGTPSNTYVSQRASKDVRFHMTLGELSKNQTQTRALGHLFDLLYLKYGGDILFSQYMKPDDFADHIAGTASCHQQILDAVVARDLKSAKKALSHHIRAVKEDVLSGLRRMLEDKNTSTF
jgi:DNA-binding GntR family transcriptional regulator